MKQTLGLISVLAIAFMGGCGDSSSTTFQTNGPTAVRMRQISYKAASPKATCMDISGSYQRAENTEKVTWEQTGCESLRYLSDTVDNTLKIGTTCFEGVAYKTCIQLVINNRGVRMHAQGTEESEKSTQTVKIVRLANGDLKEVAETDGKKEERRYQRIH